LSKAAHKVTSFWRKLSRWTQITLLVIVLLLIGIRIALPFIVRDYVNGRLKHIPEYSGNVEKVRMNIYRGAYTIENLRIVKTNANIPVPFISMKEMDLSVQWGELFHGSMVGEVVVNQPQVNFVNGPSEKEQQTGMNKDWKKVLEDLFPFRINRFQVNDGDIRFRDYSRDPKVDIYITNLAATATNLTNTRDVNNKTPAGLLAHGKTIGEGDLRLELHMNPLADQPTFKLNAAISNMDLTALNNFMRAYGNFDVAGGNFQAYSEIAAADGKFEGYVKPLFENLDVFDWQKERKRNILHAFWEAIVAGTAQLFKNQPHNRLATKVPLSGTFEKTSVDLWSTIGGVLKNAFVRAVVPKIDRSIRVEDVEKNNKAPPSPTGRGKSDIKKPESKQSQD
jgi:hypothetical protein